MYTAEKDVITSTMKLPQAIKPFPMTVFPQSSMYHEVTNNKHSTNCIDKTIRDTITLQRAVMNCNCWRWVKKLVVVRQRGADGGAYGEGDDEPIIKSTKTKTGGQCYIKLKTCA